MPGILGISYGPRGDEGSPGEALAELARHLYPAPGLRREGLPAGPPGFAALVVSRLPGAGCACRDGVCLAFEGWLAEPDLPAADLPAHLLDRFLAAGPAFVEPLRGSFQIAVHRPGETWLFADPVASRRLFYTHAEGVLRFAPEAAPLVAGRGGTGSGEIDLANLVQFLAAGRFFAGETLLRGLRHLRPGEIVVHRSGRSQRGQRGGPGTLEHLSSFLYTAGGGSAADGGIGVGGVGGAGGAAEELAALARRAVERAWSRADRPLFLLSGGYDSRFLFETVARGAAGPGRLATALYGEGMELPGSDNVIARAVARRHGVAHRTLPWRTGRLPEQFEAMFVAQSGMTDFVFTHADELAVFPELAAAGFGAVLRGDEAFGPREETVATGEEALHRVGMSHAAAVEDLGRWLGEAAAPGAAAHTERLERLLATVPAEPADRRDTLYGRERPGAFLSHHNYHKSHFLEMVNPLLDVDLLRFWGRLPAPLRGGKRLFRECFHRAFDGPGAPPIATHGNGLDWPAAFATQPALVAWVRERLSVLPPPLDRAVFLAVLDGLAHPPPEGVRPAETPGVFRVSPVRQVARAVVLGRWWEWLRP